MSQPTATGWVEAGWLALRERADAAARAAELVEPIRDRLPGGRPVTIYDLGAGTGGMTRWLAPQLPGPQQWILYDRDTALLDRAATMQVSAADGSPVTIAPRQCDITRLSSDDVAGADLITASALLDLLTADEIDRIVVAGAAVRCPTLFTLSVTGAVQLSPPDPLDEVIMDAFNAHQRRTVDGRRLLGPDAIDAAATAFGRFAATVRAGASPWRLGEDQRALISEWLRGWVGAAGEQQPDLAGPLIRYTERRLAEAATGRLNIVLHHQDLLGAYD